jgi:fructokinase
MSGKGKDKSKPICIGAGLVALDVVMNGDPKSPFKLFVGGSCGNVLTILSFLNWETYPIARLKKNKATKELISDFNFWAVNTSLILQTADGSTPLIVHKITRDKEGNAKHRFEFKNPNTGKWLPPFKPLLKTDVKKILNKLIKPHVFYFDRQTPSSLELANHYKALGSIIFFEPTNISEDKIFQKCLKIADIIKFSHDQIKNYSNTYKSQQVKLEIETLGINGLRYRFSHVLKCNSWTNLSPYNIGIIKDSAGAGDWCSAGIISKLGSKGQIGFNNLYENELIQALNYGQALGALNCFFDGARGSMYNLSRNELLSIVNSILINNPASIINTPLVRTYRKKIDINKLY